MLIKHYKHVFITVNFFLMKIIKVCFTGVVGAAKIYFMNVE